MILKQYYLACLSHASYLVGDEKAGVAAVVDPQRDVEQYLEDAKKLGVEIRWVLLTHFHADFVSGHLELQEVTGARIGLGARGRAEYEATPLADGERIELGDVRIQALATPGHTPESTCYLVFDGSTAAGREKPHAVFTGDTLFIGDVGRPDLLVSAGMTAQELAGMLYDSTREKLLRLPDETLVYPAHGAGSACGKNLSSETVSTIGAQRRANYALQPMTKDEFVRLVAADQPDAPAYFAHDAALNTKRRETLGAALARELKPLVFSEVLRLRSENAEILDSRDAADFAASHLKGSVNIGLGGKFAHWAGSVLDRTAPIVIVVERGREHEAAMRLGRIGFDNVVGYLDGGPEALVSEGRPDLLASTERVTPEELSEHLASVAPPAVLDVRTSAERAAGAIPGSVHVPLPHLLERIGDVPRGRVVVHCASGFRSSIAASLLERAGHADVADLVGGYAAYAKSEACVLEGSTQRP